MNPVLRNVLVVIAGIAVGFIVNMGLVTIGPNIIPPPEGVNPTDMESLKNNIHLFQPKHFIFPFLAHAIGTLAGAYFAARLAASHHMKLALGVGGVFFLLGIIVNVMIPGPTWFKILDIAAAYIPMGWLGGKMAMGNK